jgi:tetratricopeptide (TPR) repeat protein
MQRPPARIGSLRTGLFGPRVGVLARVRGIGLAILLLVVATGACGCRFSGYQNPLSRSVLNSRELSQRGAAAMEKHHWTEAEAMFAQACQACPRDVDARRNYGEMLWRRGERVQAVTQLKEAVEIAPEDVPLRVRLAEFELLTGDAKAAQSDAEAAIDVEPRSAEAWWVRGRVMRQMGNNPEALADLHRALSYDPRNGQVLHELAITYLALREPQRALSNLQALIDQHPPGAEPQQLLYEMGLCYAGLGRFDDAVDSYQHALARDKPTGEILFHLSEAERSRGRMAEARLAMEQAVTLDPANPRYQQSLAQLPSPGGVTQR